MSGAPVGLVVLSEEAHPAVKAGDGSHIDRAPPVQALYRHYC